MSTNQRRISAWRQRHGYACAFGGQYRAFGISDLIGELKGACSYEMNRQARHKAIEWQRGFGVVSFGKRQLPCVLDYIAKQKEHHAKGTTKRRLEQIGFDDDGKPLASA
jgi:hypothetical protein